MKAVCRCALLALLALAATAPPAAAAPYVVVLRDGAKSAEVARAHAATAGARVAHVYSHALRGYGADLSPAGVSLVRLDPRVQYVAEDAPASLAAKSTQVLPTGTNRVDADASSTKAGDGTGEVAADVAVIDSGISTHSDLNIGGGTSCISTLTSYADQYGHGTHVAGTIGARDNLSGVVGTAPGARLWAVRVFDGLGQGSLSTVLCGIDWVAANAVTLGIDVANMSFTMRVFDDEACGTTNNDALHRAICNLTAAGVVPVAAAGNAGTDLASYAPATYPEVLAVTGMTDYNGTPGGGGKVNCEYTDQDDTAYDPATNGSNFAVALADQAHTVAAPGVCILSTSNAGGTSTAKKTGTSMAAPHVAGTAALCIAAARCAGTAAEIVARLASDAQAATTATPTYGFAGDPTRPLAGRYYGYLIRTGGY